MRHAVFVNLPGLERLSDRVRLAFLDVRRVIDLRIGSGTVAQIRKCLIRLSSCADNCDGDDRAASLSPWLS